MPASRYQLKSTKELDIFFPNDLQRYMDDFYDVCIRIDDEGQIEFYCQPTDEDFPSIIAHDAYSVLSEFRKLVGDIKCLQLGLLKKKENF